MSIKPRGGMWWIRFQFRKQRIDQSTGLHATPANKSAAKEQERKIREGLEAAKGLRRIRREFTQASESFLRWVDQDAAAPATARRNRTSFASLNEFFANWKVDEITPASIEDYKTWRLTVHSVKKVTVRHDLDALSKFFAFAVSRGMAPSMPTKEVKRPSDRDAHSIYVVSPVEESAYFAAAAKRPGLYDLAKLILLTGARPDEILSLPVANFNGDSIRIQQGKTLAARRTIPLTDEAIAILERRQAGKAKWFFPSPRVPGAHLVKLNGAHDDTCDESQTFFRLYDLRHTYATRAIESGEIDVPTLAALMGHANLRSIHLYVHPQEKHKREAVQRYNEKLKVTTKIATGRLKA